MQWVDEGRSRKRGNFWGCRAFPYFCSLLPSGTLDHWTSWGFSRWLMYSWTQALWGLAQIRWPFLVRKLWREQRYYIGHAWSSVAPQLHPCGQLRASPPYQRFISKPQILLVLLWVTYGHNLRLPPFSCLFLSSLPSTSGHIFPGSL